MIIVVITGKTHHSIQGLVYEFSVQTTKQLAEKHTNDKFTLAFLDHIDHDMILPANVEMIQIRPGLKERLLGAESAGKISDAMLRKSKADRVIVVESHGMLKTPLPQFHLLSKTENFKKEKISNNAGFGFFSEKEKKKFLHSTGIEEIKCRVIPPAPSPLYRLLSADERINFRKTCTEGRDYFFVPATHLSAEDFTVLLKAFSVFKKRQQSGLRLLVSHEPGEKTNQLLKNYKYREDVSFLFDPALLPEATAAAYGVIMLPSASVSSLIYVISAMQAGAPLILPVDLPVHELAAGSFLAADEWSAEHIAGHMMRLYTDEGMRAALAEKAKISLSQLSWDKTADALWQAVQETVG